MARTHLNGSEAANKSWETIRFTRSVLSGSHWLGCLHSTLAKRKNMKIIVILFMLFAMSAAKVYSFGPEISRSGKFFRIDDQREEKILFVRRDVILSISVELRPAEEEGEFAQLILTTEEVSARQPRDAPR